MANQVLINGTAYSASNVTVVMFGVAQSGITRINYNKQQTKTNNYGLGTRPVSRGYGQVTYSGEIEIFRESYQAMIDAAPNKNPLEIPPFTVSIQYSGDGVNYKEDRFIATEFLEDNQSVNAGDTSIKITIPLIIGDIQHL